MKTEEQAKLCWCPFARVDYDGVAINRLPDVSRPGPCRCIASECMMWQWDLNVGQQGDCGLVRR